VSAGVDIIGILLFCAGEFQLEIILHWLDNRHEGVLVLR